MILIILSCYGNNNKINYVYYLNCISSWLYRLKQALRNSETINIINCSHCRSNISTYTIYSKEYNILDIKSDKHITFIIFSTY